MVFFIMLNKMYPQRNEQYQKSVKKPILNSSKYFAYANGILHSLYIPHSVLHAGGHSTVYTVGVECLHMIRFSACCTQSSPQTAKEN